MAIPKCLAVLAFAVFAVIPARGATPVDEQSYIRIGDIDQWVTVKGRDRNNPVLLNLHGGPGDAISPYADSLFKGWDKDFTVVQWDQRGAGRTFAKTGPGIAPTMTIQRMTQDGIQLTEYLARHLHKKKIILMGGSWGSILGVNMVKARPDLFLAYVGIAQIVNIQRDIAASYARIMTLAEAERNRPALEDLKAIGPPPWDKLRNWPVYRKWEQAYEKKRRTVPLAPLTINPAYASPEERAQWAAADDFNFLHFWGMTLSGPLMQVDLAKLGYDFTVPVYIIQGEQDLTAPVAVVQPWFDALRAPHKELFLMPGTGHEITLPVLDRAHKVLTEQIRPTVKN